MKTLKTLSIFLILILSSCSSDDSNNAAEDTTPTSKYAMTAKVDGTSWEVNNPFNSNFATKPLYTYYPETEYIQFQGRKGLDEIRLLIKRSDLKKGTYAITKTTFDASKTQIEVSMAYSKGNSQYPVEGSLSITSVDLTAKVVAGTFSFNCVEDDSKPISTSNPVTTRVTDGTFKFRYDFDYTK